MTDKEVMWLVVTDLDGTMLNHDTYETGPVSDVVARLKSHGIPLILNTSKTYAETISLRQELGITDAFIVENGSCLYLPQNVHHDRPDAANEREQYWEIILGKSCDQIRAGMEAADITQHSCTLLSNCTIEQAMELTGLTPEQAGNAIAREFSEPLIWRDSEQGLAQFKRSLAENGLSTLQGGRFLHVIGECDKGVATSLLKNFYNGDVKIIALGDSGNDTAMLAVADIAVVVKSPSNNQIDMRDINVIKTESCAPEGWVQGVSAAMKQADITGAGKNG